MVAATALHPTWLPTAALDQKLPAITKGAQQEASTTLAGMNATKIFTRLAKMQAMPAYFDSHWKKAQQNLETLIAERYTAYPAEPQDPFQS